MLRVILNDTPSYLKNLSLICKSVITLRSTQCENLRGVFKFRRSRYEEFKYVAVYNIPHIPNEDCFLMKINITDGR